MTRRTRTQLGKHPTLGVISRVRDDGSFHTPLASSYFDVMSSCDDEVEPARGTYFHVHSVRIDAGGVTKLVPPDDYGDGWFYDHIIPDWASGIFGRHVLAPSLGEYPTGNSWATTLLAKTNPSVPVVPMLSFLGDGFKDLAELPKNLYHHGVKAIGESSNSTLGIKFNLLPNIKDLLELTRLSAHIDKRALEWVHLFKKGGLHRQRTLHKERSVVRYTTSGKTLQESHLPGKFETITTRRVWGNCRWKPSVDSVPFVQGNAVQRDKIRDIVLGIGPNKSSVSYLRDAWELIPWSWLGDYFSNTGEWLEANEGENLHYPDEIFIMEELFSKHTAVINGVQLTGSTSTKHRIGAQASLSVGVGLLSPSKLLTLAALTDKYRNKYFRKLSGGGSSFPPGGAVS